MTAIVSATNDMNVATEPTVRPAVRPVRKFTDTKTLYDIIFQSLATWEAGSNTPNHVFEDFYGYAFVVTVNGERRSFDLSTDTKVQVFPSSRANELTQSDLNKLWTELRSHMENQPWNSTKKFNVPFVIARMKLDQTTSETFTHTITRDGITLRATITPMVYQRRYMSRPSLVSSH